MTKLKGNDPVPATVDLAARIISPEKVAAQVGAHLLELAKMSFVREERPSIKLRLNPQELGTVEVMIERNETGGLNATFRTETVEAQHALSQNLETLRETLQNSGWQVGKMDVSSGADFSRGNQQPQQEGRGNARVLDFLNSADAAVPESGGGDRDNRLVSLLA
jgi:flagellar hook-length control protein FliK